MAADIYQCGREKAPIETDAIQAAVASNVLLPGVRSKNQTNVYFQYPQVTCYAFMPVFKKKA